MNNKELATQLKIDCYLQSLTKCFTISVNEKIELLARTLVETWHNKNQLFICGNGGSAANAIHLANDFHYGIGVGHSKDSEVSGMKVESLSANSAILTCLANDIAYSEVYAQQLTVKANKGDILLVLSGSGNSKNIVRALITAKELGVKTFAIVGYEGGECLQIADEVIHLEINDMQIAEDTQLIIGHLCMQYMNKNKPIR